MALRRIMSTATLLLFGTLSGCTSGSSHGPAISPAGEPVTAWTEEQQPGPGFHLFLRNNRATPIRITSVQLYDCENVDHACLPFDPRIVLRPGQSTEVMSVGPGLANYAFSFHWRYSWTGATSAR
jgi:hypothetical protein